jgi:2-keto-4-pentenoate hydratase/2-oxohepta-3-ene-1,7-dioic acid hydratase in catechol pathway
LRLVSYLNGDQWRAGVLVDGRVLDAAGLASEASLPGGDPVWASVRSVIARSDEELRRLDEAARQADRSRRLDPAQLRLGPPVPDAEKILCIGLNYLDHQQESAASRVAVAEELPRFPMVFNKFRTSLIGDGDPIEPPAATKELDFESELAVVIGKEARNVPVEQALDHVAGYAPFNDVSARDLQLRSAQWAIGKGFDTSAPFGPCLVLRDEVPDPQALTIVGRLNGEVMQRGSTSHMIFSVAALIEYISQAITLVPGDIIATGTPAGVGFARKPPVLLKPGDVFEVEIEGVGLLSNPIIAPRSNFVSRLETAEVAA